MSPYANEEIKEVRCPKCGGHTWDNRATKRNPKQPDYKCKDKQCDGVIWPPRESRGMPQPQTKPVSTTGYSAGPHIPAIDGPIVPNLDRLFALYGVCLAEAIQQSQKLNQADFGATPEAVTSMAATMFIAASKL